MDRLMTRLCLSGKSFIPLLSSFACAIPGVMATRVIEDRRDRMTTILVAPLMSCSARLPVYTLLIAAFIPPAAIAGFVSLQAVTMVALYSIGVVAAAGVAWALKRTVFRGPTPPFVMELPAYKWPSTRVVVYRMLDRGWSFVRRAGTIIVAVSIVMWALLYYPRLPELEADRFTQQIVAMEMAQRSADDPEAVAELDARIAAVEARADGEQKRNSLLGRAGRLIEPVVRPLGWDWRIGAAAIASFPAREVVVATLGVIFDIGTDVEGEEGVSRLQVALQDAEWRDGRRLFTVPVALSIMVFFALCAQCVSTLAVIRRETNSWAWPAFSFAYMTALAYVAAFITYQLGTLLAA
jgi:ferrous iron transport protein B